MKKLLILEKKDMLVINGGDEYTYSKGYEVGKFFGKIAGMLDRFTEIFKL